MKKSIILLLITVLIAHLVKAQDNDSTVEKGLASIHVGLLGTWITYEKAIGEHITLNGQFSVEGGFFGSSNNFNYIFIPSFTLEPRWYYNFNKRMNKGKKTINNAANYIALEFSYIPDWFTINNVDNIVVVYPHFYVIPKWGLRRIIGERFSFEFAAGYGAYLTGGEIYGQFGLDLKFGYIFYKRK